MRLSAEQESRIQANIRAIQKLNNSSLSDAEIRQNLIAIIQSPIDETNTIRLPLFVDSGVNIHFGKHDFINVGVTLVDLGGIYFGDQVLVAPQARILTVNHPFLDSQIRQAGDLELHAVHLKDNCWIGAGATILPGITVGTNAIVAAGAVVSHDVPDNAVVAGLPAKVIKYV